MALESLIDDLAMIRGCVLTAGGVCGQTTKAGYVLLLSGDDKIPSTDSIEGGVMARGSPDWGVRHQQSGEQSADMITFRPSKKIFIQRGSKNAIHTICSSAVFTSPLADLPRGSRPR